MMRWAALCACVAMMGVTVACGDDRNDAGGPRTPHGSAPPGGTAVNLTEREFRLTADIQKVPAGPVKFTAINLGSIEHELVVVRTDYPDGKIPLDGDTFSEDATGVSSPGEISEYKPNTVDEAVIDLPPGLYQLVCNIPTHYHNGMHLPFVVLPA